MLLKDVKQEDKMHINPAYSCNGYLTTPEEVPRILWVIMCQNERKKKSRTGSNN